MGHLTRLFQSLRCARILVALASLVAIATGAQIAVAVDSIWSNPAGGRFHDSRNWDVAVPLPSGHALFDLNSTFTVTFADVAANDRLLIRRGRVTFDLGGLTYSLASEITVADPTADVAALTVTGGKLRSNRLQIGLQAGESGYFGIGSDGRYEGGNNTSIGLAGNGEAIVEAGGQAIDVLLTLGELTTATGELIVRGAGSNWRVTENLTVGKAGVGDLNILDGGTIDVGVAAVFGESPLSNAQIHVAGNGSSIQSDALVIARRGTAHATVADGGTIDSRLTTLAEFTGASADVTLAGAGTEWNTELLYVGGTSSASGGDATIRVSDAAVLNLGLDPVNELKIWNNGRLVVDGGSVRAANLTRLGSLDFQSGLIEIVGGRFTSAGPLVIDSEEATANPTLHLRDGATTAGITALTVGRNRSAALLIGNSAIVTATDLLMAERPASIGTVTVSGVGSKLSLTGSISVGGTADVPGGAGTLTVSDRSLVELPSGTLKLWPGGTISLAGGTLSVASYEPRGGTFDFSSGTFEVRSGNVIADHSLVTHLLGPAHDVHATRRLRLPNLMLDSTLQLNGGSLECQTFVNNGVITANAGQLVADQFENRRLGYMRLEGNATVAAAQIVNAGEISVNSDTVALVGDQFANTGIISGFGRIAMRLQNSATGEIRADPGRRLTFLQSGNSNSGRIESINAATTEFRGDLTNEVAGSIVARDGTLRFSGGLTNEGNLVISSGLSEVFGDVVNDAVGRITIASESTVLFYDDLVNQGTVHVGDEAMAVHFGTVSGAGSFTGKGTVRFEGSFVPGSPLEIEGDFQVGAVARLTMEVASMKPGNQYGQLRVLGHASVDGTLDVTSLDGFAPSYGQAFDLFDFHILSGEFDAVRLPDLRHGLVWDTSLLYSTGTISVVPEPAAVLLLLFGGLAVLVTHAFTRHLAAKNRLSGLK